jgi:hypothetical protein
LSEDFLKEEKQRSNVGKDFSRLDERHGSSSPKISMNPKQENQMKTTPRPSKMVVLQAKTAQSKQWARVIISNGEANEGTENGESTA